ncbi:GNAT family N-acetyltransferase [Luteolibacter marinus]|uniref:GNAT family N-acetyltransferase n=1 Tax=Luteolibacter marinus TaxID=2776705 RepID=UPI001868CBDF|nr:GNAT family N-acetyltransferase [Luteolibacter marinus]
MNLDALNIRLLTRAEFDTAVEWAAAEGWNPGLHDADVFWNTDPEGFVGAEYHGELVATGSVVSYEGRYGFMGFFIVRDGLRGQGIGTRLWFHRRDRLRERLRPGAAIGMDGVFNMQDWYAKGGFVFSHRNLRMEGVGAKAAPDPRIVALSKLPFEQVAAYDLPCFGVVRDRFLRAWIQLPDSRALGFMMGDRLAGYGVIRRCRTGHKIGPLFADDPETAAALFDALADAAAGEAVFLDVPENHDAAMELARKKGMQEVFGCARMYHGPPPVMVLQKTYGITTFELG